MKKIIIAALALTLSSNLIAQDSKMEKMDQKMPVKDHIMMKDGKMMVMKNGKTMAMEEDMTLPNGTMLMMDGTVKMKNGKSKKMEEGDMMTMDGKMTKAKKSMEHSM